MFTGNSIHAQKFRAGKCGEVHLFSFVCSYFFWNKYIQDQITALIVVVLAQLIIVPLLGGAMLLLASKMFRLDDLTFARCWIAYLAAYFSATVVCGGVVFALSGQLGTLFVNSSVEQGVTLFVVILVVHWIVVPLVLRTTYFRAILAHSLAILLTSTLVALAVIPALQSARASARLAVSKSNLKQLAIGMLNFHDYHRVLPARYSQNPEGQPQLSWRVHLLPYLGETGLYDAFHIHEPWDSPHNLKLVKRMPRVYRSPSEAIEEGKTCYLAPVGEFTIFPKKFYSSRENMHSLWEGKGESSLSSVRDGYSYTIAFVEVTPERAVTWTKPDDWEYDQEAPMNGLLIRNGELFIVAIADGSVSTISSKDIDNQTLLNAFDRRDGRNTDFR